MPLESGAKPGTPGFGHNIKTETEAGRPQKQAVAIAYREAGESRDQQPSLMTAPNSGVPQMKRANDTKRKVVDEGFEEGGVFHPIRSSPGYSPRKAGDSEEGFEHVERSVAQDPKVHDPKAVAAAIGIKKYGKAEMERKAHGGDAGSMGHGSGGVWPGRTM